MKLKILFFALLATALMAQKVSTFIFTQDAEIVADSTLLEMYDRLLPYADASNSNVYVPISWTVKAGDRVAIIDGRLVKYQMTGTPRNPSISLMDLDCSYYSYNFKTKKRSTVVGGDSYLRPARSRQRIETDLQIRANVNVLGR